MIIRLRIPVYRFRSRT